MPYITQAQRDDLEGQLQDGIALREFTPNDPGELNYLITALCENYIAFVGGVRYANINAAIGALECAKLELYRRLAAPYEDSKMLENGDLPLYARMRQ